MYEYTSCIAITIICYAIAETMKRTELLKDKYIPLVVLILGIVLGLLAYFTGMPSYPAEDVITALAVGVYSSMLAVGINQIVKQTKKD